MTALNDTQEPKMPNSIFLALLQNLPAVRGTAQVSILILALMVYFVLNMSEQTSRIAEIFIFAVVPLVIAMQFIANIKRQMLQFILILVMTLMCLAFLGTGAALAASDRTPAFEAVYRDSIAPVVKKLDDDFLLRNEPKYLGKDYKTYRKTMLDTYEPKRLEYLQDINKVVEFYNDYRQCRAGLCLGSAAFSNRIRDFWYTYRPIIEQERLGAGGTDYGIQIQKAAEEYQPPCFSSAVKREPDGQILLVSEAPISASESGHLSFLISWFKSSRSTSMKCPS